MILNIVLLHRDVKSSSPAAVSELRIRRNALAAAAGAYSVVPVPLAGLRERKKGKRVKYKLTNNILVTLFVPYPSLNV